MRLPLLLSRISLAALIPALAIALIALLGVRLGYFSLATGLNLMLPSVALGTVAFFAGGAWTWLALKENDSRGWRYGATGFVGALLLLAPAVNDGIRRLSSPPLVDITTDPGTPPQFVALLPLRTGAENPPEYDGARKLLYDGKETNAIAVQKKAYPDVRPKGSLFPRAVSPKNVMFWRAFEAAKRMGWNIVHYDEKTGVIEATDSSFFFGMTYDIAVRVRAAGRNGARLDIRSKSRIGDNDGGANANRIRAYMGALGG